MGKPYSDDLRGRVVGAMASGRSCRDVGTVFNVAPSTAGNWYRQYQRTNSYAPRALGGDRRSKLTQEAAFIAERLATTPRLTLRDIREELALRGRATREQWVEQAKELLAGKPPRAKVDQAEKASGKDL